jgi:hypothetical protein
VNSNTAAIDADGFAVGFAILAVAVHVAIAGTVAVVLARKLLKV